MKLIHCVNLMRCNVKSRRAVRQFLTTQKSCVDDMSVPENLGNQLIKIGLSPIYTPRKYTAQYPHVTMQQSARFLQDVHCEILT